jgi:hypothetical protein
MRRQRPTRVSRGGALLRSEQRAPRRDRLDIAAHDLELASTRDVAARDVAIARKYALPRALTEF